MDAQQVTDFLDWLTDDGRKMQYAVVMPPMGFNDKEPDFFRGSERVTEEMMHKWANNWLEDTGRDPTPALVARLAQAALFRVMTDHVYPRRRT